jgi:transcriptional regulator with XRE-family HTH domain
MSTTIRCEYWRTKVRAELEGRGWSLSELGRRMGLNRVTDVHRWLAGTHEPGLYAIMQMADALGWTVARLLNPDGLPETQVDPTQTYRFVTGLDENGRRVLSVLSDPEAAAYLARAADVYRRLRA